MHQHHRDAIERWAKAAADDEEVLAMVVAGSLTKGYGLATSDVDGFVIVTDEAFTRRRASGERGNGLLASLSSGGLTKHP